MAHIYGPDLQHRGTMFVLSFLTSSIITSSLISCRDPKTTEEPVYLQSGTPIAGVARGTIDVPVGSPMGGYSNRCTYLGGSGSVDRRQSQYTVGFTPSIGIQTSAMVEALWLENNDQNWVMLNVDAIYAFDEMVQEVERQLEAEIGEDMDGRVVISASHTHHAAGNFSDQIHFYLGGDRYNEETFTRYTESLVRIALEAYNTREAAKIGFGVAKDWDPNDEVYRDRRPENDDLILWDDFAGGAYKDPYVWMIRVDKASDDSPMGVFFNFGIHGTLLDSDNPMLSIDAPGQVELSFAEKFDSSVVVSHFQSGGGDASPSGHGEHGHPYAQMEGVGGYAVDALYDLWANIPTSSDAVTMESITRSIPQSQTEIHVTRDGTVDWHYNPYQEGYVPDDQVYDENGEILSPLDEFNTQFGGVFCGYDDPLISTGNIGSNAYPYDGCMKIDLIVNIISGVFRLHEFFPDGLPLPLPSSLKAQTSSMRIGPVSILQEDGTVVQDDMFMGFFPGETTSYFVKHYKNRVHNSLGFQNVLVGGYSQDHEGYLLIPEDWLRGGYEPNINIWGPLQGEHIMEGNLDMSQMLKTDIVEDTDPEGIYGSTEYMDRELPTLEPDLTVAAGTIVTDIFEDFYIPIEVPLQVQPDANIPRVQGIAQVMWEGGDPGVDAPRVLIEKEENGQWIEVTTPSGRLLDETRPDILLVHTPTPLYPYTAEQDHQWWAGWQTVGNGDDRMGLELGNYRFHIYGHRYTGGDNTYPWSKEEYEIISETFAVTPGNLTLSLDTNALWISMDGPAWGYRLIDMDGSSRGANPPYGVEVEFTRTDGTSETVSMQPTVENDRVYISLSDINGGSLEDITKIDARDMFGNLGSIELP